MTQAESQLRGLTLLQRRVDRADPASLAAIRAEVVASVAATQALTQQVQGSGSAVTAERAALQQASEAARGNVTDFMHAYYDEHEFDRYLQFASVDDEQEYRRREDERKRAIDTAMAEHTPEGSLRANRLAIEQLKDAGAHGADRSPDYAPMLHGLESKGDNLAAQMPNAKAAQINDERDRAALAPPAATADASAAEAIARFRSQVVLADPQGEGHGLAVGKPQTVGSPPPPSH